jgi:chromosome segregation ATPase
MREKVALSKLLAELKKKRMQSDARMMKKTKEVETTTVKTMALEKKLQALENSNRLMSMEFAGLRSEAERLEVDVAQMRRGHQEATANFEKEVADVEKLKETIITYRREITAETKQRDQTQKALRASRTAQSLMLDRLDDMEKRSRALKTCVANTINM